jgi:cobalt transporter subunit CbtB
MNVMPAVPAAAAPSAGVRAAPRWAAVAAALLGALIVLGAGFAGNGPVHNAAHDARHAQGFACH